MLMWTSVLNLLDKHPGVEVLGHTVTLFNLLRNCQIVSQSGCTRLHRRQQRACTCPRAPAFLYLPLTLATNCLFDSSHPSRREGVSLWVCSSLMANDCQNLSLCLLTLCIFSLEKCLFRYFAHFLIGWSCFLLKSAASAANNLFKNNPRKRVFLFPLLE